MIVEKSHDSIVTNSINCSVYVESMRGNKTNKNSNQLGADVMTKQWGSRRARWYELLRLVIVAF